MSSDKSVTDAEAEELARLQREATPGLLAVDPLNIGTKWNVLTADGQTDVAIAQQLIGDDQQQTRRSANAAYIAAALNLVPRLLAERERMKSIIAGGVETVDSLKDEVAQLRELEQTCPHKPKAEAEVLKRIEIEGERDELRMELSSTNKNFARVAESTSKIVDQRDELRGALEALVSAFVEFAPPGDYRDLNRARAALGKKRA